MIAEAEPGTFASCESQLSTHISLRQDWLPSKCEGGVSAYADLDVVPPEDRDAYQYHYVKEERHPAFGMPFIIPEARLQVAAV